MTPEDDSDVSLSIWADWLEDNGQCNMSDFVRLSLSQVALPTWEFDYYSLIISDVDTASGGVGGVGSSVGGIGGSGAGVGGLIGGGVGATVGGGSVGTVGG